MIPPKFIPSKGCFGPNLYNQPKLALEYVENPFDLDFKKGIA